MTAGQAKSGYFMILVRHHIINHCAPA